MRLSCVCGGFEMRLGPECLNANGKNSRSPIENFARKVFATRKVFAIPFTSFQCGIGALEVCFNCICGGFELRLRCVWVQNV